jgi:hypothetical protein
MTSRDFKRVKDFIKAKHDAEIARSPAINQRGSTITVGTFKVEPREGRWALLDGNDRVMRTLHNRRLAVLMAVLLIKKRGHHANMIGALDLSLDIHTVDAERFRRRLESSEDKLHLKDRLSKSQDECQLINEQIRLLEKSVGLQ